MPEPGTASSAGAAHLTRMWADLEPVGREESTGGYRRYAWTGVDATLREWFTGECAALGLDLVQDRAGNQWAWWGDPDATRADAPGGGGVAIGSHLDSVPDGGAFDGPLGVVSSLATITALREAGVTPSRPLAVVNFTDEEGARFGVACAGSRIITGGLDADRARGLTDADGVSLADAWRHAGRDPGTLGRDEETLARVGAFVELHVEQGRALADPAREWQVDDPAVAVGTSIWPHGRWRLDLPGVANHAGTTALADRSDAMLAAAQVTLAARDLAERHGCVATIGRVEVTPNGVNAVPSHVTCWLDARGAEEASVQACVAAIGERVAALGGTTSEMSWTADTPFGADLTRRVHDVLGEGTPLLSTGAGHDAGVLAAAGVPSAMLFVRNPTGVSHSPAEHAETGDCHAGLAALTRVVTELVR